MRLLELFEARRNPHLNPKEHGHEAAVAFLQRQRDLSHIGVSMTTIPKLGLNPRSKYNTPIGIYFYPAEYYLDTKDEEDQLEFQDDAPFIQIFRFGGNILYINQVDSRLYGELTKKMFDVVLPKLSRTYGIDIEDLNKHLAMASINATSNALVKNYGGQLWYKMYSTSKYVYEKGAKSLPPVIWNKIIQLLGYSVVVDNKGAIIHMNEPYQGVVVDTKQIELIKTVDNSQQPSNDKDDFRKEWADLILSRYKDPVDHIKAITRFVDNHSLEDLIGLSKKLAKKAGSIMAGYIKDDLNIISRLNDKDIKIIKLLADNYKIDDQLNSLVVQQRWVELYKSHKLILKLLETAEDPNTAYNDKLSILRDLSFEYKKYERLADMIEDISSYQSDLTLTRILESVEEVIVRYERLAASTRS